MPITTLDGALAGMIPPFGIQKSGGTMEAVGVYHSFAYTAGLPGAMTAPASGLSGAAITSRAGLINFVNSANTYLSGVEAAASVAGQLLIYDRLWDNSGIVVTTTTAQTINSVAWPARDRTGTTDGNQVLFGLEFSAAATNAGAITNCTASYTNSANVAGKTANPIYSIPATPAAGTFVPFSLAAGDAGARSIQSLTLGTSLVTGTVHLVAYREIVRLPLPVSNVGASLDAIGTAFTRLYDNTTLGLLWLPTATTGVVLSGAIKLSQG